MNKKITRYRTRQVTRVSPVSVPIRRIPATAVIQMDDSAAQIGAKGGQPPGARAGGTRFCEIEARAGVVPGGLCEPRPRSRMPPGWHSTGRSEMPVQSDIRVKGRVFDRRKVLLDHPLFSGLGRGFVERLSAYAKIRTVKRGASIFAKGDPGTSLLAICSGSVKISVPSISGKDAIFNVLGEGEIFGEIALLDGQPRTADAIAVTECELLVIERRDFLPIVHENPDVAVKLIEILCARLRHSSEQVEDVMFLDLPGRLAKTLLRLSDGSDRSRGDRKVPITQREIGQIIGMSRESTNKQLRSWEQHKWVRLERGGVVVLAPEALASIAARAAERSGE